MKENDWKKKENIPEILKPARDLLIEIKKHIAETTTPELRQWFKNKDANTYKIQFVDLDGTVFFRDFCVICNEVIEPTCKYGLLDAYNHYQIHEKIPY